MEEIPLPAEKVTALNPKPTGITYHIEMLVDENVKHKALMAFRLYRHDDKKRTTPFAVVIPTMPAIDIDALQPPVNERFTLEGLIEGLKHTVNELAKLKAQHDQQFGARILVAGGGSPVTPFPGGRGPK